MGENVDVLVSMAYEIYHRTSVAQPYRPRLNYAAFCLWLLLAAEENGDDDDALMEHFAESVWIRASKAITEHLRNISQGARAKEGMFTLFQRRFVGGKWKEVASGSRDKMVKIGRGDLEARKCDTAAVFSAMGQEVAFMGKGPSAVDGVIRVMVDGKHVVENEPAL